MADVRGKSVIITGGGQGIGFALAQYLGRGGASVAIAEYDANAAQAAEKSLKAEGLSVISIVADVRNRNDAFKVASQAHAAFGSIDALINNAQITPPMVPFEDITEEHLRPSTEALSRISPVLLARSSPD